MGNTHSVPALVAGFIKEIENEIEINSPWKVSDSRLLLALIFAYSRELQLTQCFNLSQDIPSLCYTDDFEGDMMYKCAVDSKTQLLAMKGFERFCVVDMKQKKCIIDLKLGEDGRDADPETLFWLTIKDEKYISFQVANNKIVMYKVLPDDDSYQLILDDTCTIADDLAIIHCDFDREFDRFVLVVQESDDVTFVLQLRSLSTMNSIGKRIELDEEPYEMRLSADGKHCIIGFDQPYFDIVDVEKGTKQKFTSKYLQQTYAPCFINGETKYVFVGDEGGRMEIWDIAENKPIKNMEFDVGAEIYSSASINDMLAVGSSEKQLRVYDVRNWQCIAEEELKIVAEYLDISNDMKYLTLAGDDGDRCVVLKVE